MAYNLEYVAEMCQHAWSASLININFVSVQGEEKNSTSLNTKQRLHTFSRDFIFCPCWCQIQVMSKDLPQYFCIKAVFSRDDSPLSMSRPKLGMQVRYFNHNLSEESSRAHLTVLCCDSVGSHQPQPSSRSTNNKIICCKHSWTLT